MAKNNNYFNKNKNSVITIRGNRNKDMSERFEKKYPHLEIVDKGKVSNNFGAGGFKFYQHFLCRWKPICKKHKPMELGYIAWADWADRKIKMGHIQKSCPDCKRSFFKCEM